jgi:hypothetical protein
MKNKKYHTVGTFPKSRKTKKYYTVGTFPKSRKTKNYHTVGTFPKSRKTKKYHTVGTFPKSRKTKNTTLSEHFQNPLEKSLTLTYKYTTAHFPGVEHAFLLKQTVQGLTSFIGPNLPP